MKACWWSGNHRKSFLVLSNGHSGVSREAMVLVLHKSWLTKAKNNCRSVWLVGVGSSVMASVMELSTWYPSVENLNPAEVTLVWLHLCLSGLNAFCLSRHRLRNCLTWAACSISSSS